MKYQSIKFLVSAIMNITVILFLIIIIYKFGSVWIAESDNYTKLTFIGCIIIWQLFGFVWRIGKWYTISQNARKHPIEEPFRIPQSFRNATPESIENFLLGGTLVFVLSGLGRLSISESYESLLEFLGLGVLFLGFAIAFWGRIVLGLRWHRDVRIPTSLVQNGPYKYVRNPIYAGEIIMTIGTSVWSHNLFVLVLLFGGMCSFNYLRCLAEEETLLKHFGAEYIDYAKERPRFFPFPHFW